MVALPIERYITPDEYLRRELEAETKNEYEDGSILAMAGASFNHSVITFNLGATIAPYLQNSGCTGVSSDVRVRVEATNSYYYPDLTVVCGKPTLEERVKGAETLTNPTLFVEVLPDSTERQDRGRKWDAYQSIESLSTYVLVSQDRPRVEVFSRTIDANTWEYRKVQGIHARVELPVLGCEIPLSAIFVNIEFEGGTLEGDSAVAQ